MCVYLYGYSVRVTRKRFVRRSSIHSLLTEVLSGLGGFLRLPAPPSIVVRDRKAGHITKGELHFWEVKLAQYL